MSAATTVSTLPKPASASTLRTYSDKVLGHLIFNGFSSGHTLDERTIFPDSIGTQTLHLTSTGFLSFYRLSLTCGTLVFFIVKSAKSYRNFTVLKCFSFTNSWKKRHGQRPMWFRPKVGGPGQQWQKGHLPVHVL